MEEVSKIMRLSKAAKEFNVGLPTILEFLGKKGFKLDHNPNTKITPEMYDLLAKEYQKDKSEKELAKKIEIGAHHETLSLDDKKSRYSDEYEWEKETEEITVRTSIFEQADKQREVKKPEKPAPEVSVVPLPEKSQALVLDEKTEEPPKTTITEIIAEPVAETPPEPQPLKQETVKEEPAIEVVRDSQIKILGKIDIESFEKKPKAKTKETKKKKPEPQKEKKQKGDTPLPEDTPAIMPPAEVLEEVVAQEETPIEIKIPEKETDVPDAEIPEGKPYNFIKTEVRKLEGPTILGSMKLPEPKKPEPKKPVASSSDEILKSKKKKRKRIKKQGEAVVSPPPETAKPDKGKGKVRDKKGKRDIIKPEISDEEIQRQIKETLQRLSGTGKSKTSKYRREKRAHISQQMLEEQIKHEEDKNILKVTEFVTANELATMMNVSVNQVISTFMSLDMFVSINQRLDAETLVLVADEFGYKVEFVSVEVQEAIREVEEPDSPEDLSPRAPIATVMGHVDHGKTSLLDYIRNANVIAGEAGGITQHIGAYEVKLSNGKKITFLDTPGHEAFTAMRARGAKITDVAIIVVAADDTVMPQTVEAINHAHAAGVPIVFAINKIDKPNANPEKIKEELSKINILVEDWGGKYQSQEISAKKGINVDLLLEKVLLEAEMLDLRANSKRPAFGTVIESSLDKGKGYVAKILVQNGSLKVGDFVLAGSTMGKVKAMFNERNQQIKVAGPATPLLLLGLNGAPQAGDTFNVMTDEREAKNIAVKRQQLQREQGLRTQKHITLDEIGRRIAIGDFKELNIIVKGDVDGSIEALSDSLLKLSNPQVQVNIIHKSVGAVTESDVLLASASNAIIVAFQVRPSVNARKLAEQEQIDIRLYSIIYNAINEIKDAIEGMLSPEIEEKITCNVEVREVFKITKVGTVAGCMVLDGKITRNTKIRLIRDGIVTLSGLLSSLKRFKDDVKEAVVGQECGLSINNFNDIRVGDIVEGYEEIETKRKL